MSIPFVTGGLALTRSPGLTACPAAATFGDMLALLQTRISASAALLGRGLLLRA